MSTKPQPFESAHRRAWAWQSAPLRPGPQDIGIVEDWVSMWLQRQGAATPSARKALLLGVTAELTALCEYHQLPLTAVDLSQAMIDEAWLGDTPMRRVIVGDWLDLPLAAQSVGLVLGDGVSTLVAYPSGLERLGQQVHSCLMPEGLLMLRCFSRPAQAESVEQVMDAVRNGRIGNFNIFRFRLLMALHGDTPQIGVRTSEACDVFDREFPDASAFFRMTGWPPASLSTLAAYKANPAQYFFPSPDEIADTLSPWFELQETRTGDYEFAACCPSLRFVRRGT